MNQRLVEKYETLVVEIGNAYLNNMELELGKKYNNNSHEIDAALSDAQYAELKTKYNIENNEFADLYSEFQEMKPTKHLKKLMDAFTASGGNASVEPIYDEDTQRLRVSVRFVIKGNTLEKIEGLAPLEEIILKMNAMIQVETILSGSDPDISRVF